MPRRASVGDNFLRHIFPFSFSFFSCLFFFHSILLLVYMLLVWLWCTFGFALWNGIVPNLRNVFAEVYSSFAHERSYQMSHRTEINSFHSSHLRRAKRHYMAFSHCIFTHRRWDWLNIICRKFWYIIIDKILTFFQRES